MGDQKRKKMPVDTELWLLLTGQVDERGKAVLDREVAEEDDERKLDCLSKVLYLYRREYLPLWTLYLLTGHLGIDDGKRLNYTEISRLMNVSTHRLSLRLADTMEDLKRLLRVGRLFWDMPFRFCGEIHWPSCHVLIPHATPPLYNRKTKVWTEYDLRWHYYREYGPFGMGDDEKEMVRWS